MRPLVKFTDIDINWNVEPAEETDSLKLWKECSYGYSKFNEQFKRPWDVKYDNLTASIIKQDHEKLKQKRAEEKQRVLNFKKEEKEPEHYVPVPPHLLFPNPPRPYSKISSLSFDEMKVYFNLHEKFSKPLPTFITPMETTELEVYEKLKNKIRDESVLFNKFALSVYSNALYQTLKEEIKEYVFAVVKIWWQKAFDYPRYFSLEKYVPLIHLSGGFPVKFIHVQTLLQLGRVAKLSKLDPNMPATVPTGPKVLMRYPVENIGNTQNLCDDGNIEKLIMENHIDVVTSPLAMSTLLDRTAESWTIPVVIREYSKSGKVKKVVYIEEKLCPLTFNNIERCSMYYNLGVKTLLTHPVQRSNQGRPQPKENVVSDSRESSPGKEPQPVEAYDDIFGEDSDITKLEDTYETRTTKPPPATTKEPVLKPGSVTPAEVEDSDDDDPKGGSDSSDDDQSVASSADSDENLVIDLGEEHVTDDKTSRKAASPSVMTRSTRSSSRLQSKLQVSKVTKCNGKETKQNVTKRRRVLSSSNTEESDEEAPVGDKRVPGVRSRETEQTASKIEDQKNSPKKAKVQPLSSKGELQSDPETPVSDDDSKTSFKKPAVSKVPPTPLKDFNVSYQQWTLTHRSKTLSLLIRGSLDGHTFDTLGNSLRLKLSCKLENQPYFGCEVVPEAQQIEEYFSTVVHPGAKLLRVRMNAHSGTLVMTEELEPERILTSTQDFNKDSCLYNLYSIVSTLIDLDSGIYLLRFNSSVSTDSAQLFGDSIKKAGNFDLHAQYNFNVPNGENLFTNSPWLPIDASVISPFHLANQQVPGCFPPCLYKPSRILPSTRQKPPKKDLRNKMALWKNKAKFRNGIKKKKKGGPKKK